MIVNKHDLGAVYRVFYKLDDQGNRVVDANKRYVDTNNEYDEMHCSNCGDYFDTVGQAENGGECQAVTL